MVIAQWWHGRATRARFWFSVVALWAIFYVACSRLELLGTLWLPALASALFCMALLYQCALRLHDVGRSSWWLLVVLIPVLGALWLVWQLGFKRGQLHNNRWGTKPGRI